MVTNHVCPQSLLPARSGQPVRDARGRTARRTGAGERRMHAASRGSGGRSLTTTASHGSSSSSSSSDVIISVCAYSQRAEVSHHCLFCHQRRHRHRRATRCGEWRVRGIAGGSRESGEGKAEAKREGEGEEKAKTTARRRRRRRRAGW